LAVKEHCVHICLLILLVVGLVILVINTTSISRSQNRLPQSQCYSHDYLRVNRTFIALRLTLCNEGVLLFPLTCILYLGLHCATKIVLSCLLTVPNSEAEDYQPFTFFLTVRNMIIIQTASLCTIYSNAIADEIGIPKET
jgi:hypothetical protein